MDAGSFETVRFTVERGVAHLVLDRPAKRNAYNIQMRDDLFQVLQAVRDDHDIRSVVVSGAGTEAFCAGADLTEFGAAPSQAIARRVRWERDVWGLWAGIRKPFVAALHGYTLGSGLEMALLCDLRITSDEAVFGLPEVGLGMVPAAGGTQTLPRVLGQGPALDLLLTGRRLNALEALRLGLVHRMTPRGELLETGPRPCRGSGRKRPAPAGKREGSGRRGDGPTAGRGTGPGAAACVAAGGGRRLGALLAPSPRRPLHNSCAQFPALPSSPPS